MQQWNVHIWEWIFVDSEANKKKKESETHLFHPKVLKEICFMFHVEIIDYSGALLERIKLISMMIVLYTWEYHEYGVAASQEIGDNCKF
jgi:hypothetical protein